jgi:ParB family protein of integrating conjugative element (PFGI_1 class)
VLSYDELTLLAIVPFEVGYLSFGIAEGVSAMPIDIPSSLPLGDNAEIAATAEPSWICVNVTEIHAYESNPRQCPNQEYDRIKASIRTQGLDQPLAITRRPGERHYLPCAGGNTRLKILQELYAESEDEHFLNVRFLYKPWVEESQVLLAHLRENELRGNLSFIDKAHAVLEAKRLLESEMSDSPISQRRLAKLITDRGLSISHSMISKMSYAVERLFPLIPQALGAGMGKPQVEKLNTLERTSRQLWHHRALGSDAEFDDTFAALCRRYDNPDWDIHSLTAALEHEIAEAADTSLHIVRLELEALMEGRGPIVIEPILTAAQNPIDFVALHEKDADATPGCTVTDVGITAPSKAQRETMLSLLRDKACRLAMQLAERNGFASVVTRLSDQGLGFMLTDVPDPDLTNSLDPTLLGQVSCLWWQLAACAELTVAPREQVLAYLDPESALYAALSTEDPDRLFQAVWTLDPGHWGNQLWRQLSDPDWRDLLQLMDTYRALHKHAIKRGTPLWQ